MELANTWTYIFSHIDVQCYPNGDLVPVLSVSENQTAIEGEIVTFKCTFGDNYSPIDYYVYWELKLKNGSYIVIEDTNHTHTYEDCNSPTNQSCCQFTTALRIKANLSLNNAIVSCNAVINEQTSYSASYISKLTVNTNVIHNKVIWMYLWGTMHSRPTISGHPLKKSYITPTVAWDYRLDTVYIYPLRLHCMLCVCSAS